MAILYQLFCIVCPVVLYRFYNVTLYVLCTRLKPRLRVDNKTLNSMMCFMFIMLSWIRFFILKGTEHQVNALTWWWNCTICNSFTWRFKFVLLATKTMFAHQLLSCLFSESFQTECHMHHMCANNLTQITRRRNFDKMYDSPWNITCNKNLIGCTGNGIMCAFIIMGLPEAHKHSLFG